MMNPVDNANNKPSRTFREVRVRPLRQGGMEKLKNWFQAQEWGEVLEEKSVDKKAEILHNMILDKVIWDYQISLLSTTIARNAMHPEPRSGAVHNT